jgi:hypothetical protein
MDKVQNIPYSSVQHTPSSESFIVCQVKINDFKLLKARISDAVVTVTPNMLQTTWNEVEYRLDICRATKGAHVEIYLESRYSEKSMIVSRCNVVTDK